MPTVPLGESEAFPVSVNAWATDKGILDSNGVFTGLKLANNFAEITNKPLARYNLGLDIGTNVQPYSSKLSIYASGNSPSNFTLTLVAGATAADWRTSLGAGTVSSINVSGGTTGLSFSGGPITSSGTLTMSGVLSANNGGTGVGSLAELKTALTLNNVSNTSDTDKPISAATQTALDLKMDKSGGTVTFASGTASAPSIAFAASTAAGIYLITTDVLGIATAGSERVRVSAAGDVGIGITVPGAKLDVGGAIWSRPGGNVGACATLTADATSGANGISLEASFASGGYGPLRLLAGGSERMRVTAAGDVGIGTSSPGKRLSLVGGGFAFDDATTNPRSVHWGNGTVYPVLIGGDATTGLFTISTNTAGNTGVERLRITNDGKVSIGTTSTAEKFNVDGNIMAFNGTGGVVLGGGEGAIELWRADSSSYIDFKTSSAEDADCRIQQNSNGLSFQTGGNGSLSERLFISSTGGVGIGVTPTTNLHVRTSANTEVKSESTSTANNNYGRVTMATGVANAYCIMQVTNGTGTPYRLIANGTGVTTAYDDSNIHIWRKTDGTQKGYFDANGNLMLGTGVPGRRLDVNGGAVFRDNASFSGASFINTLDTTSAESISFIDFANQNNIADSHLFFRHRVDGSTQFELGLTPAGTKGTDRRVAKFSIDNSGIYSGGDNTMVCGWSGNRWSQVHSYQFYAYDNIFLNGSATGNWKRLIQFRDSAASPKWELGADMNNNGGRNFYIYDNVGGYAALYLDSASMYVALNIIPGSDNTKSLGTGSARFTTVYATTGSINTSDRNAKANIQDISDALLDAWGNVKWQTFQFKDAILEKGEEGARWHFGLIAQDVRDAIDNALGEGQAVRLGLVCYDEWPTISERINGVVTTTQVAGSRWGLRYDECYAINAAYQDRRIARLEAALAVLQS